MYSLTASMGGHFEPAVCLWEERDEDTNSIHLGQPKRLDMGRVGTDDACPEN